MRNVVCTYLKLAELPGFARDSRSIIIHVLVAVSPTIQYVTPNPPSTMPLGVSRGYFYSHLCPFTCRRICTLVPNLFTIGMSVLHLSNIFEFVTQNPNQMSLGAGGVNLFSIFPFPDESVYVCQVWSRSVQGLRQDRR